MSTCKSCGAEIEWVRIDGKPVPLDPKIITLVVGAGPGAKWRTGRQPHHVSCPNAAEHRNRDKPASEQRGLFGDG